MKNNSTDNTLSNSNSVAQAQRDMRIGYGNGAVGMLVSGFVWFISSMVSLQFSDHHAIWTLLIGGMFIFPLSVALAKIIKIRGAHSKGNPLGNLAMEGTVFMLMCLPIAFLLSFQHTEWFFQGMLLIIGGRYLTFASLYGNKIFWILGAALGVAAYLLFALNIQSFGSALTGSLIEIVIGIFVLVRFKRKEE
ncbi:DUF7010 family protein [Algoriphagus winogradskyi]|uniref:DUF308 domain-containing protein n=1 Tax=Algoriphagus winogradskyi TaxID=237017 RepID=A0ABY1NF86_9BACT|nr:hypothetical protein [Algoriphagus winogradskyi]SMP08095.1 hypothetical protein SAMN06265367_101685 [Algoriphagus winogradskyi]